MRRVLTVTGAVLVVLLLGAVFAVRSQQGKFSTPEELKPGLWAASSGGAFLFAARTGQRLILFDTGSDPDGTGLSALLKAAGGGRPDVSHVFLTHGHGDHVGGTSCVTAARSYLGKGDVDLAARLRGPEAPLSKVFSALVPVPPFKATELLEGAVEIPVEGGKVVKAFPMPGHTPGSYAFLYDGVLFVGDTMALFGEALEPLPWLFEAHPEENRRAVLALAAAVAELPLDRICTSHGGCTRAGEGQRLLREHAAQQAALARDEGG
jgi:glyoxylase-like metal-dependent hydrolase (beta-lactamase superfamily II)